MATTSSVNRWPNTGAAAGPDPIGAPDATTFGGHGTHVADIIAGTLGVAPDAKLYALKACSAPTTSCSGVALHPGRWSSRVDPNGDGDTARPRRHHQHVAGLGVRPAVRRRPVGRRRRRLRRAVCSPSRRPATAPTSSSSRVRRPRLPRRSERRADRGAVGVAAAHDVAGAGHGQPWRGVPAVVGSADDDDRRSGVLSGRRRVASASVAPTRRAPIRTRPGELAGRIVLVDRGTCSFSLKIANIAAAGGIARHHRPDHRRMRRSAAPSAAVSRPFRAS